MFESLKKFSKLLPVFLEVASVFSFYQLSHMWVWGNYSPPLPHSRDKNLTVILELGEILWSQLSKCWDCRINHHTWFWVS